jgi:putative copper export protein
MAAALHLLVRLAHVLGMAVLLGGAAFTWYTLRTDAHALRFATGYEWAFWVAIGVMLATGVGNLGALGAPGPETDWGRVLTMKLALVFVLVLGSFPRTLAVLRLRRDGSETGTTALRRTYAATTALLLVVVALAEVLAHG